MAKRAGTSSLDTMPVFTLRFMVGAFCCGIFRDWLAMRPLLRRLLVFWLGI
ncbi:MAG: hypothetical protein FWC64_02800 [Treponema sp.]|nr:hypothetical protein [Treponema sp.]